MACWMTILLYKQAVFHFHVMCSSECRTNRTAGLKSLSADPSRSLLPTHIPRAKQALVNLQSLSLSLALSLSLSLSGESGRVWLSISRPTGTLGWCSPTVYSLYSIDVLFQQDLLAPVRCSHRGAHPLSCPPCSDHRKSKSFTLGQGP